MAYNALKVPLFGLNSGSFGNDLNGMQWDREGHSVTYFYCHVFAEKALTPTLFENVHGQIPIVSLKSILHYK